MTIEKRRNKARTQCFFISKHASFVRLRAKNDFTCVHCSCSHSAFQSLSSNHVCLSIMASISPDDAHLENAMGAAKHLCLRDLASHVCVWGANAENTDLSSPSIKHFVDLATDVPKTSVDLPSLQAMLRYSL